MSSEQGLTKRNNMKRVVFFLFAFAIISNSSFSQFTLKINIVEIKNNTGKIMFQLFDEKQTVLKQEMGTIVENKCSFSISGLEPGKYAVRYYHDENQNGKMETNAVGKPVEGYGFSNNVTGRFGPPSFDKWLFEITSDKEITLRPAY
jgi:uncharacterized protein (DUF2141 family)